jgi:uncharacterized protein YqhQ
MITLFAVVIVVWTLVRILQFVDYLWSIANAPRIGVVAAAHG